MPKLIELTRQFSSPKANDMCYDLFQEWHHSFPLRISNPFSKLITVSWIRFDHLLNILPKFIIEDIFIHEHPDLDVAVGLRFEHEVVFVCVRYLLRFILKKISMESLCKN